MKINKIYIKNLNSLKGEHEIDFTDQYLNEAGLIAITGETGAGKSTLLDAILLALYNRVPRYDKNLSANVLHATGGLVTKGEKEAIAAVELELKVDGKKQTYRCKWNAFKGQRGDAAHRITGYHMELAQLANGEEKIIASGTYQKVVPQVEKVIGLHYDQFIQAVMLSQGEFTKLLKASKAERNTLLEKITRTFDFRDISIKVYKRHIQEQRTLEQLQQQLALYKGLTEEEVQQKKEEEEEKKILLQEKQEVWKQWNEYLSSFRQLELLEKEHTALLEDYASWEKKKEGFQQETIRVELHEKVAPLKALWEQLNHKKAQQSEVQQQITQQEQVWERTNTSLQEILPKQQQYIKQLETFKEKEQALGTEWKQVEELDKMLERQVTLSNSERKELEQLNGKRETVQKNIEQKNGKIQQKEEAVAQANNWLQQHQVLGELTEKYAVLQTYQLRLQEQQNVLQQQVEEVSSTQTRQRLWEAIEGGDMITPLSSWMDQLKKSVIQLNEQLPYTNWTEEQYANAIGLLEEAFRVQKQEETINQKLQLLEDRAKTYQLKMQSLQGELEKAIQTQEYAGLSYKEISVKWQRVQLESSENIVALRKALRPEQPCPVCGSKEHPYGHQSTAEEERATVEKELKHWEVVLKESQESTNSLKRNCGEVETKMEMLGEQKMELQKEYTQLKEQEDKCMQQVQKVIPEDTIENRSEKYEQLKEGSKCLKQKARYEQLLFELNAIKKTQLKYEEVEAQWDTMVKPFTTYIDDPSDALGFLKKQKVAYERKVLVYQEEKQELLLLQQTLGQQQQQLQEINEEEAKREAAYQKLQEQKEKLQRQRFSLFGDKNLAIEKEQFHQQKEECATALQQLNAEVTRLETSLKHLVDRKVQLDSQQKQLQEECAITEIKLKEKAIERGIQDWATIGEQLLTEDEYQTIIKQQSSLKEEGTVLITKLQEKKQGISSYQQKLQDVTLDKPTLEKDLAALQITIDTLQEEIASIKAAFQQDKEQQVKRTRIQKKIKDQEKNCHIWHTLNSMLGSSTGDKFNNYAQALMLGILLEYANRHLAQISKRYQFVTQVYQTPTDDLFVYDKDMGEEVRAVRTLSGGETFLLSLSLALGLADMASNNIRIESLFIDEGFGTLDKETLEDVLATLENLQYETQKKIMVISHVPELQERIGTHIRLQKSGNGHSTVTIG
ncbi:AAA family ATPase [Algivirga pacifica]|uniref:AAA family ATPase n=1 Tax=Algivirga pacifica TaxID=1162670 RepID=A0ABP9DIE6_9BACT